MMRCYGFDSRLSRLWHAQKLKNHVSNYESRMASNPKSNENEHGSVTISEIGGHTEGEKLPVGDVRNCRYTLQHTHHAHTCDTHAFKFWCCQKANMNGGFCVQILWSGNSQKWVFLEFVSVKKICWTFLQSKFEVASTWGDEANDQRCSKIVKTQHSVFQGKPSPSISIFQLWKFERATKANWKFHLFFCPMW